MLQPPKPRTAPVYIDIYGLSEAWVLSDINDVRKKKQGKNMTFHSNIIIYSQQYTEDVSPPEDEGPAVT